jgi:hypothetical protein
MVSPLFCTRTDALYNCVIRWFLQLDYTPLQAAVQFFQTYKNHRVSIVLLFEFGSGQQEDERYLERASGFCFV